MKNSELLAEQSKKVKKIIATALRSTNPVVSPPKIDYPLEGDRVFLGPYSIRISMHEGAEVEVSINDEEWRPCRWAVGHYWLDWDPQQKGLTRLMTRARVGKGRWKKSDPRQCEVI